MPCKHAELMMIYAKQAAEMDEPWKLWSVKKHDQWLHLKSHPGWMEEREYRQIPKTIRIGNFDVPEPMRDRPEIGTEYYVVDAYGNNGVFKSNWHGSQCDELAFERGLCHITSENCIIHAKALFSFTEVR